MAHGSGDGTLRGGHDHCDDRRDVLRGGACVTLLFRRCQVSLIFNF